MLLIVLLSIGYLLYRDWAAPTQAPDVVRNAPETDATKQPIKHLFARLLTFLEQFVTFFLVATWHAFEQLYLCVRSFLL